MQTSLRGRRRSHRRPRLNPSGAIPRSEVVICFYLYYCDLFHHLCFDSSRMLLNPPRASETSLPRSFGSSKTVLSRRERERDGENRKVSSSTRQGDTIESKARKTKTTAKTGGRKKLNVSKHRFARVVPLLNLPLSTRHQISRRFSSSIPASLLSSPRRIRRVRPSQSVGSFFSPLPLFSRSRSFPASSSASLS